MIKFKGMSLRSQLTLIIATAIGVLLLLQTMLIGFILYQYTRESRQIISDVVDSIDKSITLMASDIEKMGVALSFNQSLKNLYTNPSNANRIAEYEAAYGTIRFMCEYNPNLEDVYVVDKFGIANSYFSGFDYSVIDEMRKLYNFTDMSDLSKGFYYFDVNNGCFVYLTPVYGNGYGSAASTKIATAVLICNLQSLKNFVSINNKENISYNILTADDLLLTQSNPSHTGRRNIIQVEKPVPAMNIKIVAQMPIVTLRDSMNLIYFYLTSIVVMCLMLLGIIYIFKTQVRDPIEQLITELDSINGNKLSKRVSIQPSRNIRYLTIKINSMLNNIEEMTRKIFSTQDKLYETDIRRKEAELYALRSQINPHMLYNTLQCIKALALVHKVPDIASLAVAMADVFRYTIKGNELINIADEINIIRQYLRIIDIRFNGKYTYSINVDDQVESMKIIKMIIQPLVENAIFHGLSDETEHGRVDIACYKNDSRVIITVTDNGKGLDAETMKAVEAALRNETQDTFGGEAKFLGLSNINRRIKLHYGDTYGLYISNANEHTGSEDNGNTGAVATIVLPFTVGEP